MASCQKDGIEVNKPKIDISKKFLDENMEFVKNEEDASWVSITTYSDGKHVEHTLWQIKDADVAKAKIYVSGPGDVPEGVSAKQGPRGGYYYESKVESHKEKPPKVDPGMKKPEDLRLRPDTLSYYQARRGNNPKTESKLQMEAHIENADNPDEKKYYELMNKELGYPDMINIRDEMQGPNNETDEDIMECWNHCRKVANNVGDIALKECYRNATEMAINDFDGRIGYVEGYYIFRDFPVRLGHAWCTYTAKSGKKIHFDPTFQFAERKPTIEEIHREDYVPPWAQTDYRREEIAYHGKEYTADEVREHIFSSELYGGLLRWDLIDHLEGADYDEQKQMFNYPAVGD